MHFSLLLYTLYLLLTPRPIPHIYSVNQKFLLRFRRPLITLPATFCDLCKYNLDQTERAIWRVSRHVLTTLKF